MFKSQIALENTDEIEATLSITMSIGDWKRLRADLPTKFPAWKLSETIGDLITKVTARIESKDAPVD